MFGAALVVHATSTTSYTPPYIQYTMYTDCHGMSRGPIFKGNGSPLPPGKREKSSSIELLKCPYNGGYYCHCCGDLAWVFLQCYQLTWTPSSAVHAPAYSQVEYSGVWSASGNASRLIRALFCQPYMYRHTRTAETHSTHHVLFHHPRCSCMHLHIPPQVPTTCRSYQSTCIYVPMYWNLKL